jgi:hypothetical protein
MVLTFQLLLNHTRTYGTHANGSLSWYASFALSISSFAYDNGVLIEETSIKSNIIGKLSSFLAKTQIGNITALFDNFRRNDTRLKQVGTRPIYILISYNFNSALSR